VRLDLDSIEIDIGRLFGDLLNVPNPFMGPFIEACKQFPADAHKFRTPPPGHTKIIRSIYRKHCHRTKPLKYWLNR
jgi:hypothetical protein